MQILGLSPLDRDATACLYRDGEWSAIAEERLSRVKMHAGFPKRAVGQLLDQTRLPVDQIDRVVYPFMPWRVEEGEILSGFLRDLSFTVTNGDSWMSKARHLKTYANWYAKSIREHRQYHLELMRELRDLGLHDRLTRIDHPTSHAAAAFLRHRS